MARTKQEVRDFLNAQVGQRVNSKAGVYNGQCVSLIKALLEFLGVPNPYAARGDAKDVGDTLLRQGIADNAHGWLMVCVNQSMGVIDGVRYGHIWLDLANEGNYEQNGARALLTTKNTRPIQQAQQIVNLDKYIKSDTPAKPEPPKEVIEMVSLNGLEVLYAFYLGTGVSEYGMKSRLGKQTFDQAATEIRASEAYQQRIAEIAKTQGGLVQHLPSAIKKVVKLPEQVEKAGQ